MSIKTMKAIAVREAKELAQELKDSKGAFMTTHPDDSVIQKFIAEFEKRLDKITEFRVLSDDEVAYYEATKALEEKQK